MTTLQITVTEAGAIPKWTRLHDVAAEYQHEDRLVKRRLKAGDDIEARDEDERTPLHWAALQCNGIVVRLLLAAGANGQAKDKYGDTPSDLYEKFIVEVGDGDMIEDRDKDVRQLLKDAQTPD